jgi:hypothetical protein
MLDASGANERHGANENGGDHVNVYDRVRNARAQSGS